MRCFAPALLIAVTLVVLGIVLLVVIPPLVHSGIRSAFQITDPSKGVYHAFVNSSAKGVSVFKAVHLFSVENPDEVHSGLDPRIKAHGPYVYREFETYNESAIYWLPNGTMRYKSFTTYEFVPGQAGLDELVTMPSFGMQVFFKMIHSILANSTLSPLEDQIVELLADDVALILLFEKAKSEPFFATHTAEDWIRHYQDNVVNLIANLKGHKQGVSIGFLQDSDPSDFVTKASNEMYTGGVGSPFQPPVPDNAYKTMTMWRGQRQLQYWNGAYANSLRGTDATAIAPLMGKVDEVPVFVDTLYRSIILQYQKDVSYQDVTLHRYVLKPSELDAASVNPLNAGFFMDTRGFLPAPPGLVTHPFVLSKPYFLDCDTEQVHLEDFPPAIRDLYETTLDYEPLTGSLFQVHKRLQASFNFTATHWGDALWLICITLNQPVFCHHNGSWFDAQGIKSNIFPAFWIDQYMQLPDHLVQEFKDDVQIPLLLGKVFGGLAITMGLIIGIVAVVHRVLERRREHRNRMEHEFYSLTRDEK